nr:protein translocase subunit SecD [Pseudobdellovibrionaceae bacterium]
MENSKLRSFAILLGLFTTMVWIVPNFINTDKTWWFTKQKLNYGLDIQGGLHLVMGVDIDGVVTEHTQRLVSSLNQDLKKENLDVTVVGTNLTSGELTVTSQKPEQMEKIEKYFSDFYGTRLQQMEKKDQTLTYRFFEAHLMDYKNKVIEQSIETLRNRIDQFGVAEPVIAKQGNNRILIQLPGIKNAEAAKQLINTTAKLNFMIVSEAKSHDELMSWISEVEKAGNYNLSTMKYSDYIQKINEDLKGKLPEKTMILLEKSPNVAKMELGYIPYLVETETGLSGDTLDDASLGFDNYGNPIVSIRFNAAGAMQFADISGNNVGRRMAIILDRVVKSAPNLKERIGGGQAQI